MPPTDALPSNTAVLSLFLLPGTPSNMRARLFAASHVHNLSARHNYLISFFSNFTSATHRDSLSFIDIAPSVSALLGLPIPFCNIGTIIPELLSKNSSIVGSHFALMMRYIENYLQVMEYIGRLAPQYSALGFQRQKLANLYRLLKPEIEAAIAAVRNVTEIEARFLAGSGDRLDREDAAKYAGFASACTRISGALSNELAENAKTVGRFWEKSRTAGFLVPVATKIMAVLAIVATSVMLFHAREQNMYLIVRNRFTSFHFPILAAVIVGAAFVFPALNVPAGLLGAILLAVTVFYKLLLIRSVYAKIRQALRTANFVPFAFGAFLIFAHAVSAAAGASGYRLGAGYLLESGVLGIFLLLNYKRVEFLKPYLWTFFASLLAAIMVCPAGSTGDSAVDFVFLSVLPTVLLLCVFAFGLVKRVYHARLGAKLLSFLSAVLVSSLALYQQYETTPPEQPVISGLVYSLTGLQLMVLLVSALFVPRILYTQKPALKYQRISTLFSFLFVAAIPAVAFRTGATGQVLYLASALVAFISTTALKECSQINGIFNAAVYSLLVHQAIVSSVYGKQAADGIPWEEQALAPMLALLVLMPVISIHASRVEYTQLEAVRFVQTSERRSLGAGETAVDSDRSIEPDREKGGEPERVGSTVSNNYLLLLLCSESVHLGMMVTMLAGKADWAFALAPVERRYREVNGMMCGLIWVFSFVIGNT